MEKKKDKKSPDDKGDDKSKPAAVSIGKNPRKDAVIYDAASDQDSPHAQDQEVRKGAGGAPFIKLPAAGALSGTENGGDSNRSSESTDVPEDFLIEWDEWAEYSDGIGAKAYWDPINMIDMKTGAVVEEIAAAAMIPTSENQCKEQDFTKTLVEDRYTCFPSLPCIPSGPITHREKIDYERSSARFYNAMVSRPVGRSEVENNPKAKASLIKEWTGHRESGVYGFKVVKEYDNVVKEAKDKGVEVHMARVHGICVEKNYQLKEEDPRRKYKGRGVLLGNKVKNQNWESAFFQDLGNSPASFEASRWADFYGCLPGHDVQLADAIQAYIQAKLTGPECWVELPPEAWPSDVNIKGLRRPVVRLVKALYGHPDAGTMWEQHCDTSCRSVGFKPVGEEWPSVYFHQELKLLLVVYVDDLKMAGPKQNLKRGWEMLRSKLNIEPETDLGLYLGCILTRGTAKLHDNTSVTTLTYNMEGLLKMSVEKYLEIVGKDVKLKKVATPSLPEETKNCPARAPAPGVKCVECPWCATSFDPDRQNDSKSGTSVNDVKTVRKINHNIQKPRFQGKVLTSAFCIFFNHF